MAKEVEKWQKKEGIKFLKKIGIKPGQTVLDFGCGKGNFSIPAAKIVGKKGIVYALDKDPEALTQLMKRARKEDLTNIKTIKTSKKIETNLKGSSIDIILLYDIIHLVGKNDSSNLKDRKRLYKEIFRISKQNALISVYPSHLTTHTDINNIDEVKKEILDSGFELKKEFSEELLHDEKIINGRILNFRKNKNENKQE